MHTTYGLLDYRQKKLFFVMKTMSHPYEPPPPWLGLAGFSIVIWVEVCIERFLLTLVPGHIRHLHVPHLSHVAQHREYDKA